MFTVTLEGEAELERAWGKAVNVIRHGVMRGVSRGVKEGAAEARSKHSFKNRTDALQSSIVGLALGWAESGNRYVGAIRATARHASFVEYPTKAHAIVIRRANWLHWEAPQGDHHFAKRVWHPGTKGQPFMFLAFYKCEAVMIREVEIGAVAAQQALDG